MVKAKKQMCLAFISTLLIASCQSVQMGTIKLEFDNTKISFVDSTYNSYELKGPSGTKIENGLPDVKQEGYYFVGWREKDNQGNYREVTQIKDENSDKSYFYYPYGTDVLYPYFEKEVKVTFEAGDNSKVIAPEATTADFNSADNTYSGYTNKVIISTSSLPTATKENARFQYWYTTKKITKVSNTEGGGYHYTLDQNSEDGIYRFDTSFGTEYMKFLDSDFTLYAYYENNPYVTLNFGLSGVQDCVFQAYDENIEEKLKNAIKTTLGVDYSDSALYYPKENPNKKLAGIYLDAERTKSTSLDIKVSNKDVYLYLTWDDKTTVTLDYNGGKVGDDTSKVFSEYYVNDIISEEEMSKYVPTKENAKFEGWKLTDGSDFIPGTTKITKNMTITAQFSDNPVLTVNFVYPLNYSKTNGWNVQTKQFSAGDSLQNYMEDLVDIGGSNASKLDEEYETFGSVYQVTNDTASKSLSEMKFVEVTNALMPSADTTYYIPVVVNECVTLKTYIDSAYKSSEDITKVFSSQNKITLGDFGSSLDADVLNADDENDVKIFDGLYTDSAFKNEYVTERNGRSFDVTNPDSKNYIGNSCLYRKLETGVYFTFKKVDGTDLDKIALIPGKRVSDNNVKARMKKFSIEYSHFYEDAGCTVEITSVPNTSQTIYVK